MKFCFFVVVVVLALLAITGHKIRGKTVMEHVSLILKNDQVKEGVKDIRVLVGEAMKAVGSEIADEVTEEEKKELDTLIQQELEKGKK